MSTTSCKASSQLAYQVSTIFCTALRASSPLAYQVLTIFCNAVKASADEENFLQVFVAILFVIKLNYKYHCSLKYPSEYGVTICLYQGILFLSAVYGPTLLLDVLVFDLLSLIAHISLKYSSEYGVTICLYQGIAFLCSTADNCVFVLTGVIYQVCTFQSGIQGVTQ
jgi:hypothetical protein